MTPIKLPVPLIRQPKDSLDCGIAGIAMLIQFHGIKKDFASLQKEITTDSTGTYAPQLGSYLMKNGFDVTITTMHPALFTVHDSKLSAKNIKTRFEQMFKKSDNEQNRKVLRYYIRFLSDGGHIKIAIPQEQNIHDELKQKRPLGVLMTTNFLNNKMPGFNFHFNIITGIDERYIYTNDPMWDERGGKKRYLKQEFFYGLHASTYGDLDNGTLILVKKKSHKK